jgi:hypothetical protein
MKFIILILAIYAFISLIKSFISLINRRKFFKLFSIEIEYNDILQLLQISLFLIHPKYTGDINSIENNSSEIKQVLSTIKKLKEKKSLEKDDIDCIENTKYKLKNRLSDLIRLDSAYIFVNLTILLMIFYMFL